nr:hypothetical protein [Micromonospora sp. DSM 115978]
AEVAATLGPPPPAVPIHLAAEATAAVRFENGYRHTYPGCFVCGPARNVGDGLRILPGAHPSLPPGTVAATWRVDESLADPDGSVPAACVWAALDCASYWAHRAQSDEVFAALLAQLAVTLTGKVTVGGEYVVVAQADEAASRRLWGRTALYHPDGTLVGQSRALWIRVAEPQPAASGLSRTDP